uniref:Uncharacterized protein n=1 Tax=Ignisphaera aggregans TaxID=334771 RepID=A0A7J3Z5R4_9CREN
MSKGTVGNTLRAMVAKGLLEKRNGVYVAIDMSRDVLLSRVDPSRVRFPWQVLRRKETATEDVKRVEWEK